MSIVQLSRSARRGIASIVLAMTLSACVTSGEIPTAGQGLGMLADATGLGVLSHENLTTFRTSKGDTALRRSRIDGSYEIIFPKRRERIPLTGMSDASVVGVWNVGRDNVVVVRGLEADCPVSYRLVTIGRSDYATSQIGNCSSEFRFSSERRWVLATEQGAADPQLWHYEDRKILGPILKSALNKPRQETAPASRTASTRPSRTTRQASASPGRATRQAAAAPEPVAMPMPSRRLEAVGDEVVPAAVAVSDDQSAPTVRFD